MASVHNLIVKRGEAEILKNFSAEFPEHQVTAVSGRSGCGKTTLLSVLLNLLPADSGEIHGFQKPSAVFQAAAVPHRRQKYFRRRRVHGNGRRKSAFAGRVRPRGPQKERRAALRRHGKARFHRPRHADKR